MLGFIFDIDISVCNVRNDFTELVDSIRKTVYTDNNDTLDRNDPSMLMSSSDTSNFSDCSDTLPLVESSNKLEDVKTSDISTYVDSFMYTEPLVGLPASVLVDGMKVEFGAYLPARRAAITYCLSVGIPPYSIPRNYAKADKNKAKRIACLYDELEPTPHDELTQASYRALADETLAQWQVIKATGLQVEYSPTRVGAPDPYSNPRKLIIDMKDNNHIFVTSTRSSYGMVQFERDPLNPLLEDVPDERISGEVPLVNDILRLVHDYFGHTREGLGFRFEGEYNAWRGHLAMYSPLAKRAITMELWGQNCWINYGPFGDKNRSAKSEETKYPQQKLGLLPEWVSETEL